MINPANIDTATLLSWLPIDIAFHLCIFLLVSYSCLNTRREPTSALLWMFVAWSFPVVGPLLFLMFGINRVPRKALRKHQKNRRLLVERQARENAALPMQYWHSVRKTSVSEPKEDDTRYLNQAFNRILPEAPLLAGNRVIPLVDGDQAYPSMLAEIRNARHHIHVQTFIVGNDDTGRQFLDLLVEKAAEGVAVRFLYDRFGSTGAVLSGFFLRYSRTPNMHIAGWTQANLLKRQFQVNLRNHRKIIVIDGKTGFIGGINLRGDNLSRPAVPAIRDYHFMVQGPVVQELQYAFLRDWYFVTDEDPDALLHATHFPAQATPGKTLARLVNSGPTPEEMESISKVLFECLNWSKKELLIVTPYFAPGMDILQSFKSAALRGVDIRLLVPSKNNHIYTGLAGRALYDELLASGVRIFERMPPFMHAKALVADGKVALVGSANLDIRSLRLNYEANLALFDSDFAAQLRGIIMQDFSRSSEINLEKWRARPPWHKLVENFFFLMTPVL